jgi:hypothetical protein
MNESIDKQIPPIKPLCDTWNSLGDVADWLIELDVNFNSYTEQEINSWYIDSLVKILDSFSELIRICKVVFSPSSESKIKGVIIEWQQDTSYEDYIENIFTAIKEYPTSIEELEIKVDLFVFVRTEQTRDKPIRVWIRQCDEFLIRGGHEFGSPYICFSLTHTVFAPFSLELEEDNKELHLLNQPFLEKSLKSWEKNFGSISEYDGSPKVYKYGFKPDEEWDKS